MEDPSTPCVFGVVLVVIFAVVLFVVFAVVVLPTPVSEFSFKVCKILLGKYKKK